MSESTSGTEAIPNLWPGEFKVDVQTPYTILRIQANLLGKMTSAILVGDVETESVEKKTQHRLVVVAPAYHGYRHNLVVAIHNPDLPYPAEVRSQSLHARQGYIPIPVVTFSPDGYPIVNSDDEMRAVVAHALRSDETKALILSLIAKSNEAMSSSATAPQAGAGDSG
jgi:hypothetical protein